MSIVIEFGLVGFGASARQFDVRSHAYAVSLGIVSVALVVGPSYSIRCFRAW